MTTKHNMETLGAHPKYQKVRLGARQAVRQSTPGVARVCFALWVLVVTSSAFNARE